jgi:histidine triad (HIT) family protein
MNTAWKASLSPDGSPPNCVFCGIIAGQKPGKIVFQDDRATAFWDIHPVAPVHMLIVPNKHISSVNEITPEDEPLIGHLFIVARQIASQEEIDRSGYRVILNTGSNAGQAVFHLHLHLIGGQRMRFPMG